MPNFEEHANRAVANCACSRPGSNCTRIGIRLVALVAISGRCTPRFAVWYSQPGVTTLSLRHFARHYFFLCKCTSQSFSTAYENSVTKTTTRTRRNIRVDAHCSWGNFTPKLQSCEPAERYTTRVKLAKHQITHYILDCFVVKIYTKTLCSAKWRGESVLSAL